MGITYKSAPEFASIEAFVEFCLEDERTHFTHQDLRDLAYRLKRSGSKIRPELESYGLHLAERKPEVRVRGFTTSSHDRWFGPGSSPTHGGSGFEPVFG